MVCIFEVSDARNVVRTRVCYHYIWYLYLRFDATIVVGRPMLLLSLAVRTRVCYDYVGQITEIQKVRHS